MKLIIFISAIIIAYAINEKQVTHEATQLILLMIVIGIWELVDYFKSQQK
jgi:hypothetical protein